VISSEYTNYVTFINNPASAIELEIYE